MKLFLLIGLIVGAGVALITLIRRQPEGWIHRFALWHPVDLLETLQHRLRGDTWSSGGLYRGRNIPEGHVAIVRQAFVPQKPFSSQGKVSYEGEIWSAVSTHSAECFPKGASCVVRRQKGLVLHVEPAKSTADSSDPSTVA